MHMRLERVHYMPKELSPGVLYVSEEFSAAAHLCACGCGAKIRTPLGPTEWSIDETAEGPSLWPSVGNWQQSCRSHYCITRGSIVWAEDWTHEQVQAGREHEMLSREAFFADRVQRGMPWWRRLLRLIWKRLPK